MSTEHLEELIRLRRIEGQVRGLQKMIEDKRYCIDILTQFSSVIKALKKVEERILHRHIKGCVKTAARSGKEKEVNEKLDEVLSILDKFRNH
jgi:DNA-binding FrmR family transcriptional regulator